jgi:hypothetical protein
MANRYGEAALMAARQKPYTEVDPVLVGKARWRIILSDWPLPWAFMPQS